MHKYRGLSVKVFGKACILKDEILQDTYESPDRNSFFKVVPLSSQRDEQRFNIEKYVLSSLKHPNIVTLEDSVVVLHKGERVGILVLEKCPKGNLSMLIQQNKQIHMDEGTVLRIATDVLYGLEALHSANISHRDIKPDNILFSSSGAYKLSNFARALGGSVSVNSQNRIQIQEEIETSTTTQFRAPQQLDLYSGFEIGTKLDIFSLGCLLFLLCFKRLPFETRLSAINSHYFIPQQNPYSPELLAVIKKCFTPNPLQRPTAKVVLEQIISINHSPTSRRQTVSSSLIRSSFSAEDLLLADEFQVVKSELSSIQSVGPTEPQARSDNMVSTNFMNKIRNYFNQMTTETEGWILGFIEESEEAPTVAYNKYIISKCWEKRYKNQKALSIIDIEVSRNMQKTLVILKSLILVHDFLRKGPPEAIGNNYKISSYSICLKIYKAWKNIDRFDRSEDKKRHPFSTNLILMYSLILLNKIKLSSDYASFIEGNYSLVPYFTIGKDQKILSHVFLEALMDLLEKLVFFHDRIQNIAFLVPIQRTMILSLVDEEYCLVSLLVHLLVAFKQATNYLQSPQIDEQAVLNKISHLEKRFREIYDELGKIFSVTQRYSSLFAGNNLLLDKKVPEYIAKIPILSGYGRQGKVFKINEHLNYNSSICGLTIPLTYEEVIKNPNFMKNLLKHSQHIQQAHTFQIQPFMNSKNTAQILHNATKFTSVSKKEEFYSLQEQDFEFFEFWSIDKNKKPFESLAPKVQMMEFTHQNLNKNFYTPIKQKEDQFKEFLSFAEQSHHKKADHAKIIKRQQMVAQTARSPVTNLPRKDFSEIFTHNKPTPDTQVPQLKKQIQQSSPNPRRKTSADLLGSLQQPIVNEHPIQTARPRVSTEFNKEFLLGSPKKTPLNLFKVPPPVQSVDLLNLKTFVLDEVVKNARQYILNFQQLKFYNLVGNGHSSEVYRGMWRGQEVAIKKIKQKLTNPAFYKQFQREIMTSVRMRPHPNLISLIGVAEHLEHFYIISQYCYGGTLFSLLHETNVEMTWATKVQLIKQIAQGMLFLHTNQPPIIHRDLKSLNVLISYPYTQPNDRIQIKIADFGLSRDMSSNFMTGVLGTYHWMAPEIFNNQPYTIKADVYSFAIVIWQILARQTPYQNMTSPQALMKYVTIQNGRPDFKLVPEDCPVQLQLLMIRCWDANYQQRPSFSDIIEMLDNVPV